MAQMQQLAAIECARATEVWEHGNSARSIIKEHAEEHEVSVKDLIGPGMGRDLCHIRQACWAKLRDDTFLSYPQIGKLFNNRHHSTIMFGVTEHLKREAAA